jgi:dCTP deaminase
MLKTLDERVPPRWTFGSDVGSEQCDKRKCPSEFVIGITLEWLKFPFDLSGYVTGKSSWGRRGLIIETAAGIHPGFTGCLTLELANVGAAPIKLSPGMQICQIFLHLVESSERASSTQFVGYRKPGLGQVAPDMTSTALSQEYFE